MLPGKRHAAAALLARGAAVLALCRRHPAPRGGLRPSTAPRRRVAQLRRRPRQHEVLPAGSDRRLELRGPPPGVALDVGRRGAGPRGDERGTPPVRVPDVPGDARSWWAACSTSRPRCTRWRPIDAGTGRDDLGARPAGLPRRPADPLLQLARGRLLVGRRRRADLLRHQRGLPDRARREDRGAGDGLRRRRPRRPDGGHPARRPRRHQPPWTEPDGRRVAADRRARRRGHPQHHLRRGHHAGGAARLAQGRSTRGPATSAGCSAPCRRATTSGPRRGATSRGATRATRTSGRC